MDKLTKHLIKSGIRRAFLTHPNRLETLERAKKYGDNYICENCFHLFERHEVETDHIEFVGLFTTWDEFIKKVFVTSDKLQVLCIRCHKEKTSDDMKLIKEEKDQIKYLETRSIFDEIRDFQKEIMTE